MDTRPYEYVEDKTWPPPAWDLNGPTPGWMEAELPPRIINCLRREGWLNRGRLRHTPDEEFLKIKHFGQGSVNALRAVIGYPSPAAPPTAIELRRRMRELDEWLERIL